MFSAFHKDLNYIWKAQAMAKNASTITDSSKRHTWNSIIFARLCKTGLNNMCLNYYEKESKRAKMKCVIQTKHIGFVVVLPKGNNKVFVMLDLQMGGNQTFF